MEPERAERFDGRCELKDLHCDQEARRLVVEWGDGHVSRFPFVWLRHLAYFPALGRPGQADDAPCLLPEEPETPLAGSARLEGREIEIHWRHDDSKTRHDLTWLRDNCPSPAARRGRRVRPKTWQGREAAAFEVFDAAELGNAAARLAVFEQLRDRGIVLLRGLPPEPGKVTDAARHFGPVRRTHHGSVFSIRSLPVDRQGAGQHIGATAANAQAVHTDEAFRHGPLGIMFFHCLSPDPSGGGASLFVDGIGAAEALRRSDPDAFAFLTTTALVWAAERNPQERFRTRAPLIATDSDGIVRGLRVADRTLPPLDLPEDKIEAGYRALRAFFAFLYAPERVYERRLEPGEVMVFDNQRVLHARRAFDRAAGERHIQQVSVDREEFHSVLRRLAGELGRDDLARWEPDAGALSHP